MSENIVLTTGIYDLIKDHFNGKIYVLINGSSFSASSIIASKLKDAKRAILVGEETGGANDGTVAGRYSTKKLPNSRLKLPIGLMLIKPDITYTFTKKGVVPNKKILPSLEQIFQKKDVQLQWIFDDIENNKNEKAPE
jgi:C-terminal processing protease CtpA/Prc